VEYARLSNPDGGTDSVQFSHAQRPTLVADFKAILDRGLKAENSNVAFLHLNMRHTNVIRVSGLLGNEGWELVSYATLTKGHEYFVFKRELPATG
jgi:hypothetical protein